MQVTINVDPKALTKELQDFVTTLTPEDKNTLIKDVVTKYYSDFRMFETEEAKLNDSDILEKVRKYDSSYNNPSTKTDDQLRAHYKYSEFAKEYKTLAQITRQEISNTIQIEMRKKINDFVTNDPEYQTYMDNAMEDVKKAFPAMIQQALIHNMINQLPNIQSQLWAMQSQVSETNQRVNQLGQRGNF